MGEYERSLELLRCGVEVPDPCEEWKDSAEVVFTMLRQDLAELAALRVVVSDDPYARVRFRDLVKQAFIKIWPFGKVLVVPEEGEVLCREGFGVSEGSVPVWFGIVGGFYVKTFYSRPLDALRVCYCHHPV